MAEKKPALIAALLILVSLIVVIYPTRARALEPLVLKQGVEEYSLGPYLEYLEDKSGKLTIDDVSSPGYEGKFTRNNKDVINFGTTDSAVWARFSLNNSAGAGRWIIKNGFMPFDMTLCSPEGKRWTCRRAGQAVPFKDREIRNWFPVFRVETGDEAKTFYLRSAGPIIIIAPILYSIDRFMDHAQVEAIVFSFVTGLVFLLFLFNVTAGIYLRRISYIYLSLFIIIKQMFIINAGGFAFYLLWPGHETINLYANLAFIMFSMVPLMLYLFSSTNTKRDFPKFYYFCIFMIPCILAVPFVQLADVFLAFYIAHLMGTVIGALVIILIIFLIRRRRYTYFWCGLLVFMIGEFVPDLVVMGVLSSIELWWHVRIAAHTLTSILFTFSVIDQYRISQREKADAQAETVRVQAEAVATLEGKVEERTKELAAALEEVGTINDRLTESNAKLEGFGASLRKYLPHQLVSCIMEGKVAACNETERKKLTIFFSDIKAFTDTTDSLEAEELSNLLNEYLTEMTAIAMKHGGTIDKFIGDAVMIFFGAPETKGDREDALQCLRMAVAMQGRMKELQAKWFKQGIERPLQIRIGVNTGIATVGDFGAEERLSYTTIGGQVNLASRLESICEPGKILISHATWALVSDEFPCTPKGEVQVKGIHHDVLVYEVGTG